MKKERIKSLSRNGNAEIMLDFLIKSDCDFELQCSNYSLKMTCEEMNVAFFTNMQSKRTFAGFSKLKSDLSGVAIPDIDRNELIYFVHNFKKDAYYPEATNIDLKSAYTNILFNDGLIAEATYKYIAKMDKHERLACVGMLASRKEVFNFSMGEPDHMPEIISPLAPFFYYAVKRTYEIMSVLKKLCGRNYLFTWVDGIYFIPDAHIEQNCIEYLESISFPSSVDVLKDFNVKMLERKVSITFKKEGKNKKFDLPFYPTAFQKAMLNSIINSHNKLRTNEKNHSKISR